MSPTEQERLTALETHIPYIRDALTEINTKLDKQADHEQRICQLEKCRETASRLFWALGIPITLAALLAFGKWMWRMFVHNA